MKAAARIQLQRDAVARLKKTKVKCVDVAYSDKGILRTRTTLKLDGQLLELGAVTNISLHRLLKLRNEEHTDSADRQIERVVNEYRALLFAHPEYRERQAIRARKGQAHLLHARLDALTRGAVANGVELDKLLELVRARWNHHLVVEVMES